MSLSTDSSSDRDESKAVLTSPQAGWDRDTGWVGGQESPPHSHRNNKRLGREQEGGGGRQEQRGGGVELGPRWQTFRYLCYATLTAVNFGAKENFYKAPKAPKLIYTVTLWYSFVMQSPPRGGDRHLMTVPPLWGEPA